MRRLIPLLLASSLLLSGCWDQQAIERLGFVTVALAAGHPGSIDAYLQTVLPTKLPNGTIGGAGGGGGGGGGAGAPLTVDVAHGHGTDLYSAVRDADTRSAKRLYFGQIEVVLLTDSLARAGGLSEVLDYFVRGTKTRNIAWVYLVRDTDVQKILQTQPLNASYPSEAIVDMSLVQGTENLRTPTRVFEVITDIMTPGKDAAIPLLEPGPDKAFQLGPTGLFRHGILVGYMSDAGTRGLALLKMHVQAASIVVTDGQGNRIALETAEWMRRFGSYVTDGQLKGLYIDVHTVLHTGHISGMIADPNSSPPLRRQLLDAASGGYVQMMTTAIRESQAMGSDPVGFGVALHAYHPTVWRREAAHWNEIYPHLPVAIFMHALLNNSGMVRTSIHAVH